MKAQEENEKTGKIRRLGRKENKQNGFIPHFFMNVKAQNHK